MRRRASSISLASKLEEAEEKRNVSAERRRSTAYTFSVRASLSRRSRTVREPEASMPRSFPFSSVIVASRFAESLPDGERFVEGRTEPFEGQIRSVHAGGEAQGDGAQCPFEVQSVGRCPTGAQGQTDGIGQVAGKRPCFQIEAGDELFVFPCGDMLQPAPGDAETAGLELPVGEEGFCGVRQGGRVFCLLI